jgi:glycosyltransferase involved in cell wall biosynthesis
VFPYWPSAESASGAVRLAIAAGRPIIVSDSGIFEDLRDVGRLAPSNDPESLVAAIRDFVDPRERAFAEARVRRFARSCAWERIASGVWGDLRAVAADRARRGAA